MPDIVRIVRVLEYVGTRECVEQTLCKGGVPSNGEYRAQNITIKSALIGSFCELVQATDEPTKSGK